LHWHGIAALAFNLASDLDFQSASPSVVKSIKQRDLLNTWLRLYARGQLSRWRIRKDQAGPD
jgi:hypothetical protein